jgi:hypothetical protein
VLQQNPDGIYRITASAGQVLTFSLVGSITEEVTIGATKVINVKLKTDSKSLNEVVVTALGQTVQKRALGTSQQTVSGADIAGTQRENFINSLAGRVAGVEVNSTSGVPGASTSITIRGVSSISSNNSPLFIVDGYRWITKRLTPPRLYRMLALPHPTSNRATDFTNRAADINPEDIEKPCGVKRP